MKLSTKKRIGALALLAFNIKLYRWQGYYGLLPVTPWPLAIIFAVVMTIIALRIFVWSRNLF